MARGFSGGYARGTNVATGELIGGGGRAGAGGVRRDAEVEASQRSLSSGGDVGEAVARVQNAGGGELKLTSAQAGNLLSLRNGGIAVGSNGAILMDMGKVSDSPLLNGQIKMFDANGKERKMERTVTVQIVENGISGYRMGTAGGTFQPARGKATITEEQKQAILTANLPLQMKNARFNQSGQINGWKISPEIFPDKATRAALYKNMGRDGVLRFSSDSPVGKALGDLRQGNGINLQKLNNLVG